MIELTFMEDVLSSVFVVTKGSYSDYHIVAVFTTRELADKFVNGNKDFNEVEDYELDLFEAQLRQGLVAYTVSMFRNGDTRDCSRTNRASPRDLELSSHATYVSPQFISGDVWATDQQHAIKIVNEKRMQLIANNEWPDVG